MAVQRTFFERCPGGEDGQTGGQRLASWGAEANSRGHQGRLIPGTHGIVIPLMLHGIFAYIWVIVGSRDVEKMLKSITHRAYGIPQIQS